MLSDSRVRLFHGSRRDRGAAPGWTLYDELDDKDQYAE